jgi:hypothetical protein
MRQGAGPIIDLVSLLEESLGRPGKSAKAKKPRYRAPQPKTA